MSRGRYTHEGATREEIDAQTNATKFDGLLVQVSV
jgi:hypothetical protein